MSKIDDARWQLVLDTLDAYDVHFRILFGLDKMLMGHLGIDNPELLWSEVVPRLVKEGRWVVKDGVPITEPEELDMNANFDKSSPFFAIKRIEAQMTGGN